MVLLNRYCEVLPSPPLRVNSLPSGGLLYPARQEYKKQEEERTARVAGPPSS